MPYSSLQTSKISSHKMTNIRKRIRGRQKTKEPGKQTKKRNRAHLD